MSEEESKGVVPAPQLTDLETREALVGAELMRFVDAMEWIEQHTTEARIYDKAAEMAPPGRAYRYQRPNPTASRRKEGAQ